MDLGLKGKKVFITGSSRGIGFATAKAFLHEGLDVILNGRTEEALKKAEVELEKVYGNHVYSFCGDMTKESDVEKAEEFIRSAFGSLDILVANIGSGKSRKSNPLDVTEWKRFYKANIESSVLIIDRLYELLKEGSNPSVTMISSVVSREVASAPVGYAAAKAGVRAFSKYLSYMWAEDGIRVNCVLPGNVYFKGGRWEELKVNDSEGVEQYINSRVPMKRFGRPEEIANVIVFLSSDRASFITGAEIVVDGGQLAAI